MEICNNILSAIKLELISGEARPTRIQAISNLAYDKLVIYLGELEVRRMTTQNPLGITERGRDLLQDYDLIRTFSKKWASSTSMF